MAHRVVAETWLEIPDDSRTEVNHINGIKNDFHPSNLEWVTPSENSKHAWTLGLKTRKIGVDNPNSKLSEKDVVAIRSSNLSSRKLGSIYGVDKKVILNVKNRVSYTNIDD